MRKKKMTTFAERAYSHTPVEADVSEEQMKKLLEEVGITDMRITQVSNDYQMEFLVRLRSNEVPRKVRIDIPFTPELDDTLEQIEQKKKKLFRVAYWHLKDRFVVVQNGLKEFEEAFLPDLVVIHNNREVRLGEVLVQRYKEEMRNNKVVIARKLIN